MHGGKNNISWQSIIGGRIEGREGSGVEGRMDSGCKRVDEWMD